MSKALPTNESLLLLADILHNYLPNRRYDTIAVGAIGYSVRNVKLVVGINSAIYHDTKLTSDRIIPPRIRNSGLVMRYHLTTLQEPYHAEISILLAAKEENYKIFGLAASRKICDICNESFKVHAHLFDRGCEPVDAWEIQGQVITQIHRQNIEDEDWPYLYFARAIKDRR